MVMGCERVDRYVAPVPFPFHRDERRFRRVFRTDGRIHDVLEHRARPEFERYRNILLDDLSYYSDVPLGGLALQPGSHVIDVGCGWGDTAIALARKVGATGSVLGLDCCDAFLQKGRDDARAAGIVNVTF